MNSESALQKGIYVGPPHFWHQYALNPRERYYYSYYGMYGPYIDPLHYKPIQEEFRWSDGCHNNQTLVETALGVGAASMLGAVFYMIVVLCVVTLMWKLVISLLRR